ncbi:unnamed protein product [Prorocentrum cordatum]|uniref:Uncharacterized protein n=1 Tax=Prorocentrum cordatum TaxID=2364126 RepID=A0ABN9TDU5_9DINO|nr:unnamed protein product [Polarella glacialis]
MARAAAPLPLPPLSAREPRHVCDRSVEDLEAAVRQVPVRRPAAQARPAGAPQTARGLLEVNRALIEEKKEKKALQRQSSREEFERLLERNRATTESEKSRALTRRIAERELAQCYKSKIGEKEKTRTHAYSEKLANATSSEHWPFNEGETIDRVRGEKGRALQQEMRGYLQEQRRQHPPRAEFDPLVAHNPTKVPIIQYPVSPRQGLPAIAQPPLESQATSLHWDPGKDSHLSGHPRFLQRAAKPSGRRPQSDAAALAARTLEEKVAQTKRELEATSARLVAQQLDSQDSLMVNDALKYDKDRSKAAERRRNAEFQRRQMEEKQHKAMQEAAEAKGKCVGYWGPEEKPLQDSSVARVHCGELIQQMEVDHQRRNLQRGVSLREEKKILSNALQEMVKDRSMDQQRAREERSVLTTTWGNQRKILEAKRRVAP